MHVCIIKLTDRALVLAYPHSVRKFWRLRLIMFNIVTAWIRSLMYPADMRSEAFTEDEVDKIFSDYQPCMWFMIIN